MGGWGLWRIQVGENVWVDPLDEMTGDIKFHVEL